MKSVKILTFSGTGNTAFVAEAMAQALRRQGVEADTYPLEKLLKAQNPQEYLSTDVTGIAFPVHAFNPPPLVEKILRQLPAVAEGKYFIIKTAGDPFANGGTTTGLQKIMLSKGWKLLSETLVPMPSNVLLRYPDQFIKLIAQMAVKSLEKTALELVEYDYHRIRAGRITSLWSQIWKVERLGARFYGRYLKVESNCTQCGLCARACPTDNIRLREGKFRFGWNCTLCLRCSFHCPVQAISQQHMGRLGLLKSPYDLQAILTDPGIKAADLTDDSISGMKHLRQFWFRAGVIE